MAYRVTPISQLFCDIFGTYYLTRNPVGTLYPQRTETVHNVVGQPKRNNLRHSVGFADVEQAVHINVEGLTGGCVHIDVFQVSVAQSEDVADDRHDGRGARESQSGHKPGL